MIFRDYTMRHGQVKMGVTPHAIIALPSVVPRALLIKSRLRGHTQHRSEPDWQFCARRGERLYITSGVRLLRR